MNILGLERLDTIPNGRSVLRNKYNFNLDKKIIGSKWEDTQLLSLTKYGVKAINDGEQTGKVPASLATYQSVDKNDLVMCLFDLDVSAVFSGISGFNGMISPAYKCFKCKKHINPKYADYYYQMIFDGRKYKRYSKNVRYSISGDEFMNLSMLVPPINTQLKIVNYLGEKISKIDGLYTDIENQIEKLEEYKKCIITEAITKGLNTNTEMKNTGIDYIGYIPSNWCLSRLKYNLKEQMKYGASETGVDYSEDLPRYIRITDITSDNKLKDEGKLSLTFEQANGYILKEETILFARSGGTVGKSFLYKPSYGLSAFAGYLISAIPNKKKMYSKWLYYYTLSNAYWEWANMIFTQATIQNIGADKYCNLPIPIPSLNEQSKIIEYLDIRCNGIDDILSRKKKQLDILDQYKKSLIYEYITGKKEVPSNY